MEQFKKEVEKKIGEEYDVYCIVEEGNKMYASIIAKEGMLSVLNFDTPIYVKEGDSIKEEPSSSETLDILNKGKIIYTHPTLWEEDEYNENITDEDKAYTEALAKMSMLDLKSVEEKIEDETKSNETTK